MLDKKTSHLEGCKINPDQVSKFKVGQYLIDIDKEGRLRGRFILKRMDLPWQQVMALDAKVRELYPNCELVKVKRARCGDGSIHSWWVVKWDKERCVLQKVLYRKARKSRNEKISQGNF